VRSFSNLCFAQNVSGNKDKGTTDDSSIPANLKLSKEGISGGNEINDEGGIGTFA
jgi:hypothetical protein